jgi:hypothetical protein
MIRYRYADHIVPPAPFVHVSLRCPTTGSHVDGMPAQLDTAADRTVLPDFVVERLGLAQVGHLLFQGFGSQVLELPTYVVSVTVHDLSPVTVKVVLGEREPYILLGRDVLNAYRFLLDGPQSALEIG